MDRGCTKGRFDLDVLESQELLVAWYVLGFTQGMFTVTSTRP